MITEPQRFDPVLDSRPVDTAWPDMVWPVPPHTVLRGTWVTASTYVPEDAPAIFAALDHRQVWAHLADRPANADELGAILQARATRADWQVWVVRTSRPTGDRAPGEVIGTSSYLEVAPVDARLEVGSTAYAPSVWATAVNPETKLLLLGHAFETLRAGRVQLKTDVRNVRSQQAIARLGATYEGTLRRYQRRADGTVRDTVLFSIIAEDWPAVRDRLHDRIADHQRGAN